MFGAAVMSSSSLDTCTFSAFTSHQSTPVECHLSYFAPPKLCLARSLVCARESSHVLFNVALVSQELHVCTVDQDAAFLLQLDILVSSQRCETPVLADNDLLAAREFVH